MSIHRIKAIISIAILFKIVSKLSSLSKAPMKWLRKRSRCLEEDTLKIILVILFQE